MKAFLTAAAVVAALGVACAENCTSKVTTTVTRTLPVNETAIMPGTSMTSIYNNTTSVIEITGEMTNPMITTITVANSTVLSTITVPAGTCTIDQQCASLTSENVNGTSISDGPTLTTLSTSTDLSSGNDTFFVTTTSAIISTDTDIVSGDGTFIVTTTLTLIPTDTAIASDNGALSLTTTVSTTTVVYVSAQPGLSTSQMTTSAIQSITATSFVFVTQVSTSTLLITAESPSEPTGPENSTIETSSGTFPYTISPSIPNTTVTVFPLPENTTVATKENVTITESVPMTLQPITNRTSITAVNTTTSQPLSTWSSTVSNTNAPPITSVTSSPAQRLSIPRPITWVMTIIKSLKSVQAAIFTAPTTTTQRSSCPSNLICLKKTTQLSTATSTASPTSSHASFALTAQTYKAKERRDDTTSNGTSFQTIFADNTTVPSNVTTTSTVTVTLIHNIYVNITRMSTTMSREYITLTEMSFNNTFTSVELSTVKYRVYETVVVTASANGAAAGGGKRNAEEYFLAGVMPCESKWLHVFVAVGFFCGLGVVLNYTL